MIYITGTCSDYEKRVWKGRGNKRRCVSKKDEMVYIPLIDTIQSLLRRDSIIDEVHMQISVELCIHMEQ